MLTRVIFLLLSVNLLSAGPLSASWINFVTNYSRSQYKGGSQNWQVVQDENNWMYFANKMGLLEYTGESWSLYPVDNHSDVRSILKSADNQRIYVGAANEIGFVGPTTAGKLKYHCLSCKLPKEHLNFGTIWGIQEVGGTVYFIAEHCVIRYRDSAFTFMESPEKIDCSNQVDGMLYLGTTSGLYTLKDNKFLKLQHTEILRNKKIKSILPYRDKLLVGTASEGFFLVDEHAVLAFHTAIDAFLKQNELFCMAANDQYIAVGTILKGVAMIDLDGKLVKYFNESHGLQNNTVLSLFFDHSANLWLGLDNGLASISLDNSISELYRAPRSYGAGYAAALYKNRLYLGTNRGLYYLPWPIRQNVNSPELKLLEPMQGQVWDIEPIDNELFCSLDKRLFIITNDKTQEIGNLQGVWSCRQSRKDKSKVWVSTYNGLFVISKKNGRWGTPSAVEGFKGSLMNFEEGADGRLWGKTPQGEVYRVTFNKSMDKVIELKNFSVENTLPYCNHINLMEGTVLLATTDGVYAFNNGVFERYELQRNNPNIYMATCYSKNTMWLLERSSMIRFARGGHQVSTRSHHLPLISNFEKIYPLNDTLAIVCNENGFALWNSAVRPTKPSKNKLRIVSVSLTEPADSVVYYANFSGVRTVSSISFNSAVTFHYKLSDFDPLSDVLYRFKLDQEAWSAWLPSQTKTYGDLPIGNHVFTVESTTNGEVLSDTFAFNVLPPWYRTSAAYLCYLLIVAGLVAGTWHVDSLRMRRKKKQMELRQRKELWRQEQLYKEEAAEREREIIKLKNERLELEVKHKSQELANIAVNLVRKNELLLSIKQELALLKGPVEPSLQQRQLLRINAKIDKGMEQDDSLDKFEEYFDAVHSNFIQRLSEKYPGLTINEKKICAFAKMELSVKEIAPLLNMTVRGVETIRYRLRKKFDLSRDDSLVNFLNSM